MTSDLDTAIVERLRADADILRASFVIAADRSREFATCFYEHLFRLAPSLRSVFPDDMSLQQDKFAQTMNTIVAFLDNPHALQVGLRQLGARHVRYGTAPTHYAPVGEALLETLEHMEPGGLSAEASLAWKRVYGWIAGEMLSGALELQRRQES